MNVTALLDVPAQRSASPLDSAVGNDATDPAFANVMSRYQSNGNDSLADGSQSHVESNASASAAPVPSTTVDAEAAPAVVAATTNADPSGGPLPLPTSADGRLLPPTIDTGEAGVSGEIARPKADDGLDATDPNAAALIAFVAPLPPPSPAASTAPVAVAAAPTADPVDDLGLARRAPVDQLPNTTLQGTETKSNVDEGSASAPQVDPARLIKKDGDAAALAKAPLAAATPTSDDAAPRSTPSLHALRAFGLGHEQGSAANGSANPGGGHARDPNGSSADPQRDATPKLPNVHLAAALEAAAQQSSTSSHLDGSDSPIRTDAIAQRANGPAEGIRDALATRLGDLAQQHAPRFAAELADRVLVLRGQRFDSATVSLEPRDLGRIDIQVRLQADTTHVAFTAQHAAVRDALEGQMPRLRAMLEEAGLSLGTVDVSQSGSRGGGDSSGARPYAQPQTAMVDADAVDPSTRWQRRIETSLIDLHA